MSYMFYNCYSLFSLNDISKWDTSNIKIISNIFNKSSSLLDVLSDKSKWKIKF
jgi:surface protein